MSWFTTSLLSKKGNKYHAGLKEQVLRLLWKVRNR